MLLQTVWLINAKKLWWESLILQESCRPESSKRSWNPYDLVEIISVPISPHLVVVHTHSSSRRIGVKESSASLIAQLVKNPPACRRPRFNSWVGKICWRRDRLPTPIFLGFPCGSAGENWVWSLGWEDPLEKDKSAPVFWPGEFRGLSWSMGLQGIGHNWATSVCMLSARPVFDFIWFWQNQ